MSFASHLRAWLKGSPRRASYRPMMEILEDRHLPSTISSTPLFNEDFNQSVGSLPATSTWTYNTGTDPNNTAVHYVDDASTLSVVNDPSASDGKALAMTIYPTSAGDQSFNSARINTAGDPGGNVEYGLIEARIKLPGGPNGQGDGLWPAFWMLGADHPTGVGWPNCGEIDVMEQAGGRPSINNGSTHFGSLTARQDTTATYTLPAGQAFYGGYHTFDVYWTPGAITFSVDGNPYATVKRSSYSAALWDQTFHQPFYLILNICDGGPNNSGGFGGARHIAIHLPPDDAGGLRAGLRPHRHQHADQLHGHRGRAEHGQPQLAGPGQRRDRLRPSAEQDRRLRHHRRQL